MRLSGAFGRPLRCRRKLPRSRVRQVYAGPGSSAGNWPCNGTAPQQQAATAQAQPGVVLQAPEDGPCCDAARGWWSEWTESSVRAMNTIQKRRGSRQTAGRKGEREPGRWSAVSLFGSFSPGRALIAAASSPVLPSLRAFGRETATSPFPPQTGGSGSLGLSLGMFSSAQLLALILCTADPRAASQLSRDCHRPLLPAIYLPPLTLLQKPALSGHRPWRRVFNGRAVSTRPSLLSHWVCPRG